MPCLRLPLLAAALIVFPAAAWAQKGGGRICPRPAAGSLVPEPEDLRSHDGVLRVDLRFRNFLDANGQMRYCYLYADGSQAPTLRLKAGDLLILTLKNEATTKPGNAKPDGMTMAMSKRCGSGPMAAASTNLHFHGLTVPPVCHQDDVLQTLIGPGDPSFEYRFRIPMDEPPGLYWYHPHVHGFSNSQVLGGASGALIVEGIESANRELAGLPERVLIVRDQELINPDAVPSGSAAMPQVPVLRDAEGDILNTGTDGGKPAKDLSLNFVPVPYPDYPPAVIPIKPSERELWRVLNASAITYLDLQVLLSGTPQPLGVVAIDGVPIHGDESGGNSTLWRRNVILPPGGRVEVVFKGPPEGTHATLVTRKVDTGPAGENDPTRALATILSESDSPKTRSTLSAAAPVEGGQEGRGWLGNAKPVRERKLYFSERPSDPNDPKSPTIFLITVDGQKPAPYDPQSAVPNITVQQGDVEDWIIENRSRELHAFHIHQIHFLLTEWDGVPVDEPFLRDTVNVPYWDGGSSVYPSVKLRMDFRDPRIVGTFVYHCHLLEHEDGGMMGTIRVEARKQSKRATTTGPAVFAKTSRIPLRRAVATSPSA
jgi:FtsP/CotA-like multicopper oxidase with cupredoxin domain